MSLFIVNSLVEANVLGVVRETLAEGRLPGLRSRNLVVLGRDRNAGLALVAGLGALGVGLMWMAEHSCHDLPNFEEALAVVFHEEAN